MGELKYRPITIMKKLGDMLGDSKNLPDEDFFDDRMYWVKNTYQYYRDEYQSTDPKDKHKILLYDLETINQLINQVLRFGRIVMSNDKGTIYNFPDGEKPTFIIDDIFSNQKTNSIKNKMRKS